MRVEEIAPADLARADLRAAPGGPRLQATPAWLDFTSGFLPSIAGAGAHLSALAAIEGARVVAAIPIVRSSPGPRPFPFDLADLFFGVWIRAVPFTDRSLWLRARASAAFGAVLGALNPSLHRALVIHPPLSPISAAMVAPDLDAARARAALVDLLAEARAAADREDRCALIPRVPRREVDLWGPALDGWTRAPSYGSGEILAAPRARVAQMIRRNARLMDQLGARVEETRTAPDGVPFGRLFAGTAARHRDPAPSLDDAFFCALGARFPDAVRFLSARVGHLPAGFLVALRHGSSWEAFKCGVDRALAGRAPVYLDLVYGRLPALAAREGAARVELGPGDLEIKRRYGAEAYAVDAFVALPRRFRGRAPFTAYVRAIGEGIARHQVASVATTPK